MHHEKIFILMIQSFFSFNNFINENVELYKIIQKRHTKSNRFRLCNFSIAYIK